MKKEDFYLNNYINYLNKDLNQQRKRVLAMFETIINQYQLIYYSLKEENQEKAKKILENESFINELYNKFLNLTIWKIIKRQFVARDLRQVIIFLIIFHELEIIADYASHIARYFINYSKNIKIFKIYINEGIIHLLSMFNYLKKILETTNLDLTYLIPKYEDKINIYYKEETKILLEKLSSNKAKDKKIYQSIVVILKQLKYIDQISERLVNIAELLIYIKEGSFFDLRDYNKE